MKLNINNTENDHEEQYSAKSSYDEEHELQVGADVFNVIVVLHHNRRYKETKSDSNLNLALLDYVKRGTIICFSSIQVNIYLTSKYS